jgi:malate dehydrogenase
MSEVLNVLVTGAAGRIAYSLIPNLIDTSIFGKDKKINLRLYDIDMALPKLEGVQMEILDSTYPNLNSIIATTNPAEAFQDADVAILLGGYPRMPGMERKDLIMKNASGMIEQAGYLSNYANPDVKVLVVANPANTNCLSAIKSATNIPACNFTCLTRLDQERLRGFVTKMINDKLESNANYRGKSVSSLDVKGVAIFGNHSTTQVPYLGFATVKIDGKQIPVTDFINDKNEIAELVSKVQNRGAAIIKSLQASSALSAAAAISKHLKDWLGTEIPSDTFSMGILSNGNNYGIPEGLVYSFPCKRESKRMGEYSIVTSLPIDSHIRTLLDMSTEELKEERREASAIVGSLE